MKIFIATLTQIEDETTIVGAYSSFDVAMSKVEKALDDLEEKNEDLGVYSNIVEVNLDDIDDDRYIWGKKCNIYFLEKILQFK